MITSVDRLERNHSRYEEPDVAPKVPPPPPPPDPAATRAARERATGAEPLGDGVDPPPRDLSWMDARSASTLLTEDAGDRQVNCLDRAADHLRGLSPAERQQAEMVMLEDTRPGREGRTGHVVVRQGDQITDPTSGEQYASSAEYFARHPEYRETGTVSGEKAAAIFDTAPGSPERRRALADAGVPEALQTMALADAGDDARFIHDKLTYGLFDWAVTDGDAASASKRLQEVVDDPNRDANAVMGSLSDTDLERLGGNLDGGAKRALADKLATELDGRNAARLAKALGYDEVASAVAAHAPARTKADFVTALSEDISGADDVHYLPPLPGAINQRIDAGNDEARAAVKVLASLADDVGRDPAAQAELNRTIDSLSREGKLDDVLKVALGRDDRVSGALNGQPVLPDTHFSPESLVRILEGAARSNNPKIKAQILHAFGDELASAALSKQLPEFAFRPDIAARLGPVGTALGRLLTEGGDTGAIISELRALEPKGTALVETFKLLMLTGDQNENLELAKKIGQATKESGSENMGYVLGTLLTATEQLKSQIDTIKNTENFLLSVAALAPGLAGGVPGVVAGVLAGLGTAVITNGNNTGADAKAALDAARTEIRQSIKVQEDDALNNASNRVLELNGLPKLPA